MYKRPVERDAQDGIGYLRQIPRGVRLHGGAGYSILSFITEKAFSVIGGDKGNASFFGRAAFTPYMVFGIEGI